MAADEFPLVGVRRIGRGAFVGFERQWRMAPGGFIGRDVLRHPGSVTAVPWDGEHAHLISQFRAPVARSTVEFPAGKLDVRGEDPAAAARRETAEEIGLVPHRLTFLHRVFVSPGISDQQAWVYLAEDLRPVAARPQGPEESAAVHLRWTWAEIVRRLDEVEDAVTLIGMLALLRHLAS